MSIIRELVLATHNPKALRGRLDGSDTDAVPADVSGAVLCANLRTGKTDRVGTRKSIVDRLRFKDSSPEGCASGARVDARTLASRRNNDCSLGGNLPRSHMALAIVECHSTLYLLHHPHQIPAGAAHHPCGRCGVPNAVIHSVHLGEDKKPQVLRTVTPPLVRYALYCWVCTWLLLEGLADV